MALIFTFAIFLCSSSFFMAGFVISQPPLNSAEQEAVYRVLESINSDVSWRSLFPDDLCSSAPHGLVCDYFTTGQTDVSAHVTELGFGYVSDYSPNPPCTPNSTLDVSLFSPFTHLEKLFFYRCFIETSVAFPDFSSAGFSDLEELVFIENPSLVGSLGGSISKLTSLRRLVLTGANVSGKIPDGLGDLVNLEQLTLSRNKLTGTISVDFGMLKKLMVLDLSQNGFGGNVPDSMGNGLRDLLKLDLSFNEFSGRIPESLKGLKRLEFLDVSYNRFSKFGMPLFLGEMTSLREVYLSGNLLGGRIPEIWGKLGGIIGIGLSGTGLVGNIPASMGIYLKDLCYLGLDNNRLEGEVPEEFEFLESLSELNFENNNLTGKVPFSAKFVVKIGEKLKLNGNRELCLDEELRYAKIGSSLGQLKLCNKTDISKSVPLIGKSPQQHSASCYLSVFLGFVLLSSL